MNNRLEEESGVLDEYRDMVLISIEIAKTNKSCIDEDERIFMIKDFLIQYFPGSKFLKDKEERSFYHLTLSNDAIISFKDFRRSENLDKATAIDTPLGDCLLSFAPDKSERKRYNHEIVDLVYPIFIWIKWTIKRNQFHA